MRRRSSACRRIELGDRDAAERHLTVRLEVPLFTRVGFGLRLVDLFRVAAMRLAWLNASTTAGSPPESSTIFASQVAQPVGRGALDRGHPHGVRLAA